MITFYPGPSKIYPQVGEYVTEGLSSGILSMNHRSPEFMDLMSGTVGLLKEKLLIPESYQIVFTSSATECWEIIAQSVIRKKSMHFYNGAFGEKWMNYTQKLGVEISEQPFDHEQLPSDLKISEADVVCFTQNETSNGTQIPMGFLSGVRTAYKDHIMVVDATSSMAGIHLDFSLADIWFASVQKCFGLPAGMAIMICSPRSVEVIKAYNENNHYNSLNFILENAQKNQTPYTPNILGMYLLNKVLNDQPSVKTTHAKIVSRFDNWREFFRDNESCSFLARNEEVRSFTVLALRPKSGNLALLKKEARAHGMVIGNGYGKWKESTFRIANFPAIDDDEIEKLQKFLRVHI